jgi:D-alanyl-D-alanine carboxypeptidase (penicillin-binding protein 5/6)
LQIETGSVKNKTFAVGFEDYRREEITLRSCRNGWIVILFLVVFVMTFPNPVLSKAIKPAQKAKSSQPANSHPSPQAIPENSAGPVSPEGLQLAAHSALLMDALTGQILYEKNPQLQMAPASFVKLMTLYLAFDALRAGQLKKDDMVTVSEKAWRIQGSKMFVKVGERVSVDELLKGIAIASGNDACIVLAEHMAGSEEAFVARMNEKAALLGLKDTKFRNSHGMPAEGQVTTAFDMAALAKRYLEDHPESLAYHSTTEYEHNGIRQGNRNTLLQKNMGVDGLKTGHVEEVGYHLLATAKRDGQRMIAVVMGCQKMNQRGPDAQTLLEYGFKNFSTVEAVRKGAPFGPVKVRRGKGDQLMLTAAEDVRVTVGKGKEQSVVALPQLPPYVVAPIQKGQALAKVAIENDGKRVKEVALMASSDIEKSWIPPWPVLVAIFGGLGIVGVGFFWWSRRPRVKKF